MVLQEQALFMQAMRVFKYYNRSIGIGHKDMLYMFFISAHVKVRDGKGCTFRDLQNSIVGSSWETLAHLKTMEPRGLVVVERWSSPNGTKRARYDLSIEGYRILNLWDRFLSHYLSTYSKCLLEYSSDRSNEVSGRLYRAKLAKDFRW